MFIPWRLLLWASLILTDQLGTLPHMVTSPSHLCDSIVGPSELQGANILEDNSFASQQSCHLFQYKITEVKQCWSWLVLGWVTAMRQKERNNNNFSIPFLLSCGAALKSAITRCCAGQSGTDLKEVTGPLKCKWVMFKYACSLRPPGWEGVTHSVPRYCHKDGWRLATLEGKIPSRSDKTTDFS